MPELSVQAMQSFSPAHHTHIDWRNDRTTSGLVPRVTGTIEPDTVLFFFSFRRRHFFYDDVDDIIDDVKSLVSGLHGFYAGGTLFDHNGQFATDVFDDIIFGLF